MKKSVIKFGILLASTILSAFSCKGKDKTPVVHIGYTTGDICGAPMHIAMANGFFDREFEAIGQKWEPVLRTVTNGLTPAELVASGKMDAGTELVASMVQQLENGLEVTFTAGIHTGCTKFFTKPDSGINSVVDLVGKKVGIPGLSDATVMHINRKLADAGIDVSAGKAPVEFVVYGATELSIALNNGSVDAIGCHDPIASIVEKEYGYKKFLDNGEDEKLRTEYCCQMFVSRKLAKENPEGAAAYTRALMKAAAYVQALPAEAAKIQLDNNYVTGNFELNSGILSNLYYAPSVRGGHQTLDITARELQKIGILKDSTNMDEFISKITTRIEGVPESYEYEPETDTYYEVYPGNIKKPAILGKHDEVKSCCVMDMNS